MMPLVPSLAERRSHMKPKRAACVFLLVLIGCQQATWEKFSSSEGAFSVLMPGTPTEQIRTAKTSSGSIDAHMFLVEHSDVAYMVAYSDYPNPIVQEITPKLILDGARDGAVANTQGKLARESIISLDGHQGRELQIEPAGGKVTITGRIFLVDRRLYQMMVLTPQGKDLTENVNKFLDSFTLQPQHPRPKS
jgi:hypothetical protein